MSAKKKPPCVIGKYCSDHGFIHGYEAEEFRVRLEKLLAAKVGEDDVGLWEIQRILDQVDARDSLAFGERRPKGITKNLVPLSTLPSRQELYAALKRVLGVAVVTRSTNFPEAAKIRREQLLSVQRIVKRVIER